MIAIPMRRSGDSAQKSASQRLWAFGARHRVLGRHSGAAAEAGAERRRRDPPGAEHVGVGEEHLGRDALGVEDLVAVVGVVARRAGRRRRRSPSPTSR